MAEEAREPTVVKITTGVDIKAMPPNEATVQMLERALEQAKAGEIVGVGIARTHHDNCASYSVGGQILGYAFMGALSQMLQDVAEEARKKDEQGE